MAPGGGEGTSRMASMVWLRRVSQVLFLGLFFFLFLNTGFHDVAPPEELVAEPAAEPGLVDVEDHPGSGIGFFFNIDPLVLITTWLAGHAVLSGMLLALVTIVFTVLMGRFFCGWLCPLGTLHNAAGTFRGGRTADRVRRGVWSGRQKSKYYVLVVLLVCGLFSVQLTGLLDPASFLYRSTATVLFPALCRASVWFFNFLYETDPGVGSLRVTAVSEPVYSFLRDRVLPTQEVFFTGGILIGGLFFLALGLNLVRNRFWCRYVCPLGALLGLLSRFTVFRVKNDEAVCIGCNQCAECCPGGADPHLPDGWHRSECFMCWNCKKRCPVDAIRLEFEAPTLRVAPGAPAGLHERAREAASPGSTLSGWSGPSEGFTKADLDTGNADSGAGGAGSEKEAESR